MTMESRADGTVMHLVAALIQTAAVLLLGMVALAFHSCVA